MNIRSFALRRPNIERQWKHFRLAVFYTSNLHQNPSLAVVWACKQVRPVEVAGALQHRWDHGCIHVLAVAGDEFRVGEEEQAVPFRIHLAKLHLFRHSRFAKGLWQR